jgi:hypothetical protein
MNNQPLRSYLQLHSQANEKITPATFRRGIINAVNIQSKTADVQLVGNQSSILKGIPLSSAINLTTVKAGQRCRVDLFGEINPNDSVVAYTY